MPLVKCEKCQKDIDALTTWQRYCGMTCRNSAAHIRRKIAKGKMKEIKPPPQPAPYAPEMTRIRINEHRGG